MTHIRTPDVEVVRSPWRLHGGVWSIDLHLVTDATFADYAIVLWGLPVSADQGPPSIQTNANTHHLARNRDDEYHLVLVFDLKPDVKITVELKQASTPASIPR